MNKVTSQTIKALLERTDETVASVYMPTHRISSPPATQEDKTRFKNMIRLAAEKWQEVTGEKNERVFGELEAKLDDENVWQNLAESLAIFITKDKFRFYHLPIECEERVHVGSRFNLTPLYVVDGLNKSYYVLAIAMHEPKLFKGDMYDLQPVPVELPTSVEEALNIDEMFANSQTVKSHSGPGASNPHGEGDSSEAGREERFKYFRIVEQNLLDSNEFDTSCPVLIAGTSSEAGDFRATTKLPNVLKDCYIQGNHTETQLAELHRLTREMIYEHHIKPAWQDKVEQYDELVGAGKGTTDLKEIQEAAKEGRVDTLIIPVIELTNDTIRDTSKNPVPLLRHLESEELDTLVGGVAQMGGSVVGVETEGILPAGTEVAAIFRY